MAIIVRPWQEGDVPAMAMIWNQVVEEGIAFPQLEYLTEEGGKRFLRSRPIMP